MNHSLCVVIPLYKQLQAIAGTLKTVEEHGLPCLLIDDGNEEDVRVYLQELVEAHPQTTLYSLPVNQGKGGAVIAGLASGPAPKPTSKVRAVAEIMPPIRVRPRGP